MARTRMTKPAWEKQSSSGNTDSVIVKENSPSLEEKIKEIQEERQTKADSVMARIKADMQKPKGSK